MSIPTLAQFHKPNFSELIAITQEKLHSLKDQKITKIVLDLVLNYSEASEKNIFKKRFFETIVISTEAERIDSSDLVDQQDLFTRAFACFEKATQFKLKVSVSFQASDEEVALIRYSEKMS